MIWKRERSILNLYGMKKTAICTDEWNPTREESEKHNSYMIFETRKEAKKWMANNHDWEVVLVEIKIISQ